MSFLNSHITLVQPLRSIAYWDIITKLMLTQVCDSMKNNSVTSNVDFFFFIEGKCFILLKEMLMCKYFITSASPLQFWGTIFKDVPGAFEIYVNSYSPVQMSCSKSLYNLSLKIKSSEYSGWNALPAGLLQKDKFLAAKSVFLATTIWW